MSEPPPGMPATDASSPGTTTLDLQEPLTESPVKAPEVSPAARRPKPPRKEVTVDELKHLATKRFAKANLRQMANSMLPHLSGGHYHSQRVIDQNIPMPVHCHIAPDTIRAFVALVDRLCS